MTESETAFMRLVRPCWRRLHVVARLYANRDHDARDLVQEALLRAWRAYRPGEARSYREGWLFVILRRVAAEWARTAARRIRLAPVDQEQLTELVPGDTSGTLASLPALSEKAFREMLDDRLADALDRLESSQREIIVLSVGGDLTYREIAEVLDCPLGTIMSRMARAREALRERLAGPYARQDRKPVEDPNREAAP